MFHIPDYSWEVRESAVLMICATLLKNVTTDEFSVGIDNRE